MYFLSAQLRRPCDVSFYRALMVQGLQDLDLALGQHKQVLSHLAQQAKEGSRTVLRNNCSQYQMFVRGLTRAPILQLHRIHNQVR